MRKIAYTPTKIGDKASATRPIRRLAHRRHVDGSDMARLARQLRIVSNRGTSDLHTDFALLARLERENADLRQNVVDLALQIQEIRTRC
jgi:hypothetical protein